MAINIDNLNLCPERIGELFTTYLADQNWFDLVNSYTGITGDEVKFVHMDVEANLATCCTTPDGTDTVAETIAPIECILTRKVYCERDLMKVLGTGFRITAGQESTGRIGEIIGQATVRAFTENLSKLAFLGNINSTDENLKFLDGYIKKATSLGVIAGSNIYEVINNAYYALPLEARRMGGTVGIFVPEEAFDVYFQYLMNQNLYHYNPGTYTYGQSLFLPGIARVEVIPTPALNGTNQILITPLENMYWFTNMLGDKDTYSWDYSAFHQQWVLYIKTLFGIAFVRPDLAVTGTFDPAILTSVAPTINVIVAGGQEGAGSPVETATA